MSEPHELPGEPTGEPDIIPPPMLVLDPASVLRVATAWHPATRVAFRFFATYFVLYVVTTQMLPGMVVFPVGDVPNLGELPPVRTIVSWGASHVFRVSYPLVIATTSCW